MKENKIIRNLTKFFVGRINREYLNPAKVRSLKMLFFDCIPRKCKLSLHKTRFKLLKRSRHYRLFDRGIEDYEKEINIVQVLRDLRYYKAAVKKLMSEKPKKLRDEIENNRNRIVKILDTQKTLLSGDDLMQSDDSHRFTSDDEENDGQPA